MTGFRTDPPYSEKVRQGGRTRNDNKFSGDNFVPFSIDFDTLKSRFDSAGLLCKKWFVATIDWRYGHLLELDPPTGTNFVRAGIWVKTNSAPQFTGDRPAPGWEFVAIMHSKLTPLKWNGGGSRAVWTSAVAVNNGHPTPKPLKLIRQWVADFTDPGDTVLDPFMGSGTTGVACMQLGRNFIGIDISSEYVAIAEKRIRAAAAQMILPGV